VALITFDLVVQYEDGREVKVTADQRDVCMFEIQPFGLPIRQALATRTHITFRWLAWHALKRTAGLKDGWDKWNHQVIEVDPDTGDDDQDEDYDTRAAKLEQAGDVDPGRPAAGEAS
jgi:hypothetical protein